MTTERMIEVMQAYADGEQIEYFDKEEAKWLGCDPDCEPLWNWELFEYRAKPKATYRPYKNADEFLRAQLEHGMYLREKGSSCVVMPLAVNDFRVFSQWQLTVKDFPYENLLERFVWQDGTPCGVKAQV